MLHQLAGELWRKGCAGCQLDHQPVPKVERGRRSGDSRSRAREGRGGNARKGHITRGLPTIATFWAGIDDSHPRAREGNWGELPKSPSCCDLPLLVQLLLQLLQLLPLLLPLLLLLESTGRAAMNFHCCC